MNSFHSFEHGRISAASRSSLHIGEMPPQDITTPSYQFHQKSVLVVYGIRHIFWCVVIRRARKQAHHRDILLESNTRDPLVLVVLSLAKQSKTKRRKPRFGSIAAGKGFSWTGMPCSALCATRNCAKQADRRWLIPDWHALTSEFQEGSRLWLD